MHKSYHYQIYSISELIGQMTLNTPTHYTGKNRTSSVSIVTTLQAGRPENRVADSR
jgi:hypothetical protein